MKKDDIYRVVIVGLGNIGLLYDLNNIKKHFFASHSKTFNYHPNFKIVAGVDIIKKT